MTLDPNLPASGILLALILGEVAVDRARGRDLYRMASSLSDVGTAVGQLVVQGMLGFTTVTMYGWMAEHLALIELPPGPAGALLAYLLMELILYWRHRAGHQWHLFWAIHEVHHQSPHYNLGVALRVGYLQWLQTACFVWPLALVGVDLPLFAALFGGIHFWQFLIHTRLVGRLGPLEWVLMTPSHHRVHHGRNPRYLDKNFGFSLILFDRLFGTFAAETEPVAYGVRDPVPSFGPLDANARPWRRLWRSMRRAPTLAAALAVPLRHPAYDPVTGQQDLPHPDDPVGDHVVPQELRAPALRIVLLAGTGAAVVAALLLTQFAPVWSAPVRWTVGGGALLATWAVALLGATPHPPKEAP
jgi:alkylglycerol monooxygenase